MTFNVKSPIGKRLNSLCSVKRMNNTLQYFILRNSKFFEAAVKKMHHSVVQIFSWDISLPSVFVLEHF